MPGLKIQVLCLFVIVIITNVAMGRLNFYIKKLVTDNSILHVMNITLNSGGSSSNSQFLNGLKRALMARQLARKVQTNFGFFHIITIP